jgi:signal peptidase I
MTGKQVHSLPWMVAVVAIIIPPLGMMIVCSPFSALGYSLFAGASWLSAYVMQADGVWPHARLFFPPVIIVHLIAAMHAYHRARYLGITSLRSVDHRCIVWTFFLTTVVVVIYQPLRMHFMSFNIASASMAPALLHGDKVIARKLSSTTKTVEALQRGDIIIFRHPENNEYQVKRIIALPGDTIRYSQQKLELNGRAVSQQLIQANWQPEDGLRWLQLPLYEETLPDPDHRHRILIQDDLFGPQGEVRVPGDSVFVMGDNRNMSIDSRDFGVIPSANIVAQPVFIGFSSLGVPKWLVRWHRIGFLDSS